MAAHAQESAAAALVIVQTTAKSAAAIVDRIRQTAASSQRERERDREQLGHVTRASCFPPSADGRALNVSVTQHSAHLVLAPHSASPLVIRFQPSTASSSFLRLASRDVLCASALCRPDAVRRVGRGARGHHRADQERSVVNISKRQHTGCSRLLPHPLSFSRSAAVTVLQATGDKRSSCTRTTTTLQSARSSLTHSCLTAAAGLALASPRCSAWLSLSLSVLSCTSFSLSGGE